MDWSIGFVMLMLSGCIVGTFFLVCSVAWYIWKEISKPSNTEDESLCDWKSDGEIFKTNCGNSFFDATESGNPITDWITYCPYCGDKVKQK